MPVSDLLVDRIAEVCRKFPERPALTAGKITRTYCDVWREAGRIAATLARVAARDELIGFLANRDDSAYLAVLAIVAAGKGYVPLNPKLPDERLRRIVVAAGLTAIVVGKGVAARAQAALAGLELTLVPATDEALPGQPGLTVAPRADTPLAVPIRPARAAAPAYLLFTSGSTGEPKGVPVSNGNLSAYLDFTTGLYGYGPADTHSQTFELTFDLSVHDMMCAWTTGGRLLRFAGAELMSPANILRREQVTSWFSTPSLGSIMARTGALKPASLPSLRVSLFCGEALPAKLAADWQVAAPASIVENLYGPTEATIAFTRYRWDAALSPAESRHGLAPIGRAFAGQETRVIGDDGQPLARPSRGMLLLGGSQVTGRYWKAPEITREKYICLPGEPGDKVWYVTGDLVEEDSAGCIHFVGRIDNQIKLRGHRIELREVENALRRAADTDLAIAVAWPVEGHEVKAITAVVAGRGEEATILAGMRDLLPDYMLPQSVRFMAELPRNLSGKIDRNAVVAKLDGKDRG